MIRLGTGTGNSREREQKSLSRFPGTWRREKTGKQGLVQVYFDCFSLTQLEFYRLTWASEPYGLLAFLFLHFKNKKLQCKKWFLHFK